MFMQFKFILDQDPSKLSLMEIFKTHFLQILEFMSHIHGRKLDFIYYFVQCVKISGRDKSVQSSIGSQLLWCQPENYSNFGNYEFEVDY